MLEQLTHDLKFADSKPPASGTVRKNKAKAYFQPSLTFASSYISYLSGALNKKDSRLMRICLVRCELVKFLTLS